MTNETGTEQAVLHAPSNAVQRLATRVRDKVGRRRLARMVRQQRLHAAGPISALGSDYGGWNVPADRIQEGWIAWCVGAGHDVSFDMELVGRGCDVRCVDPFEIFRDQALALADGDPRFTFVQAALAPEDGPLTMFGRQDVEEGGVSAVNSYRVQTSFTMPGRSIDSLMREHGDDRCDLLKIDIEGSEYDVLDTLDPARIGVQVLCVEMHATVRPDRIRRVLGRLANDYALVHVDDVADLTYVRRDLLPSAATHDAAR